LKFNDLSNKTATMLVTTTKIMGYTAKKKGNYREKSTKFII
jgi:hypothetical protein